MDVHILYTTHSPLIPPTTSLSLPLCLSLSLTVSNRAAYAGLAGLSISFALSGKIDALLVFHFE